MYPTFAVLGAVFLFATGGLGIKVIEANAFSISGTRSLIGAIFLLLVLLAQGKRSSIFRLNTRGWLTAISYAFVVTCFVTANKLTTAANAIFLQYTMPAWVLVGGALWLNEKITLGRMGSVLCCLFGMVLFFLGDLQPADWLGNAVALCSGFFFAVMTLLVRSERDTSAVPAVMMGNFLTALTNLPLAFWIAPQDFSQIPHGIPLASLLWLGIFQIGVAYILYTSALKKLPAIEVAILALIEPILNPLLVFFTMGESPTGWALIGGAVILISVLIRIFMVEENNHSLDSKV